MFFADDRLMIIGFLVIIDVFGFTTMSLMGKTDYRKETELLTLRSPQGISTFTSSNMHSTIESNEMHCVNITLLNITNGPGDGFRFPFLLI